MKICWWYSKNFGGSGGGWYWELSRDFKEKEQIPQNTCVSLVDRESTVHLEQERDIQTT
jgi:hypothetical protein